MFHWNMDPYGLSLSSFNMMANWLLPLFIWSVFWKGSVLWVTARRSQTGWFILFLILNTAGIAEIIYLIMTSGFDELNRKQEGK